MLSLNYGTLYPALLTLEQEGAISAEPYFDSSFSLVVLIPYSR
jgi:Transcriptional regulator PadR-like family